MRSGSATISRTVIRGFSDAYGSWKTIWMSRRTGRICRRLYVVMSVPSKTIRPAVGSISLMSVRPRVVFPQPDSPDDAERLAALDGEVDAVDGAHLANRVLEDPRLDRKVLDEPFDAQERVARAVGGGRRLGNCLGLGHEGSAPTPTT